ncbi:hypothetical protein D6D20_09305 [Aureobasidium pullulans]|uniref:Uncharacterized protein n=1 Tax=Aureobasidium pullulans TaxID=5580 RepID=A0A4S8YM15_AURPU|nr:hypothetical protein D6D20_09305 [Aureobasidium pullulans]
MADNMVSLVAPAVPSTTFAALTLSTPPESPTSTASTSAKPSTSSTSSRLSTPSTTREVSSESFELVEDRVTQPAEPLKTPEIMHLEAQLDEKLYDLRLEEANLKGNTESWLRLARMHQELKKEFPNINEPIDLTSAEAEMLIDCATLMVKNDLATLQMQVAMKENYKQIRKMMVEAQDILDQLITINPADRKYEEIGNTLEIKSGPGRGWEGFIKRMALVIHYTGT